MANDFKTDMNESIKILEAASPTIKQMLGLKDGEIISVENQDNDVCSHLDLSCGIDYLLHFTKDNLTYGAAWRAQRILPGRDVFNTFTIRKERESGAKTEYEKRKFAIEHGALYPQYTIHAYYDDCTKKLLSMAIARTKDIIDCINKGYYFEKEETGPDKQGQAKYYAVKWTTMRQYGYLISECYSFKKEK